MKYGPILIVSLMFFQSICFSGADDFGFKAVSGGWNCRYEKLPDLVTPKGSMACGDSRGPSLCIAPVFCEKPGKVSQHTYVHCDALSDGSCPPLDKCASDKSWSNGGQTTIASYDNVEKFWKSRDAFIERQRVQREAQTKSPSSSVAPNHGVPRTVSK